MPSRSALAYMTRKLENSVTALKRVQALVQPSCLGDVPIPTARTRAMLVCGTGEPPRCTTYPRLR